MRQGCGGWGDGGWGVCLPQLPLFLDFSPTGHSPEGRGRVESQTLSGLDDGPDGLEDSAGSAQTVQNRKSLGRMPRATGVSPGSSVVPELGREGQSRRQGRLGPLTTNSAQGSGPGTARVVSALSTGLWGSIAIHRGQERPLLKITLNFKAKAEFPAHTTPSPSRSFCGSDHSGPVGSFPSGPRGFLELVPVKGYPDIWGQ